MREITPEELLERVIEEVDLFTAPPSEPEAWARENRVPAEEIALQFYDAMFVSPKGLREHRLVDPADEGALQALSDYVMAVQSKLFLDGPLVTDAREWKRVRELAAQASMSLRRATSEKNT